MNLFTKTENLENKIYYKIVDFSRNPFFFRDCKITDDFEGRFEILVINLSLVLWLINNCEDKDFFSQKLIDIFFEDMDACLRELGVSDLSVGKKIKVLAANFYGRLTNYTEGFDQIKKNKKKDLLKKSIKKNILTKSDLKYLDDKIIILEFFFKLILNTDYEFKKVEDFLKIDFFKF